MTRPHKMRLVGRMPGARDFKPRGVPMHMLQEAYLPLDGLEAMRLVELEGLDQIAAAKRMGISRQTFGRILALARKTITRVLVDGMALRIEGDDHHLVTAEQGCDADPRSDVTEENKPMMIAVSTSGSDLSAPVEPHFGRAAGFLVVDPETWKFFRLDNAAGGEASHGAGIAAAERVVNAGASVVLTGIVGPRAFSALSAAGVKIAVGAEGLTVTQAVEAFRQGKLRTARQASDMGLVR